MKAHGEDNDMKKELASCMTRMVAQKKKQAEEAKRREEEKKNRPKIQEVEAPAFKKIPIQEDSDDSDDEAALKDKKAAAAAEKKKKAQFDPDTLASAQTRAM